MPSAPQVSSEDLRSTAQPKHVVPANDKPSKTPIASCCWSIRSGLTDYLRTLRVGAGARKQLGITEKALMMTKFRRCLSTMDLVCYGIASMIGGSIFILTGTVIRSKAGPAAFLSYLIAGIIAYFNTMAYSELSCRYPKAGSVYTYAYTVLGEMLAFLTGWAILLEYILSAASVARGWSSILDAITKGRLVNSTLLTIGRMAPEKSIISEYPDLLGAGLVILVAGITIFGIQGSAWVNNFFTGLNMIVIVMITVFMFIFADFNYLLLPVPYANYSLIHGSGGDGLVQHPLIPDGVFLPFGISGLIAGASTCFYCFIGFDVISTCAEETANPARDIPRANMIAVLLVAITISFCALSLVVYVPWYTVDINAPYMLALIGGKQIGGGSLSLREGFYYFVGIGCLLGLTGSLLSNTIAGPRIIYSMGQDRIVYKAFAYVCEPFKTPVVSILFFMSFTGLLVTIFSIESLADFLSLGTLIAYSVATIALLVIRYGQPPELYWTGDSETSQDSSEGSISPGSAVEVEAALPSMKAVPGLCKRPSLESNGAEMICSNVDLIRREASAIRSDFPAGHSSPCLCCSTGQFGQCRVGQPGYPSRFWAAWLPAGLVRLSTTRSPGRMVFYLLACYIGFLCLLIITLKVEPLGVSVQPGVFVWYWWRILLICISTVGLLGCIAGMGIHVQFPSLHSQLYRLPFVPVWPCITLLLNIVLIAELSWLTWVRFSIWLCIGLTIYMTYGVRHSNVRHPLISPVATSTNLAKESDACGKQTYEMSVDDN